MSKSRIAMRVVGVIVIFIGLLFLLVDYSLRRSFREAFGPEFDNDVRDLGVALKGAAGKALLEHGNIIPSQSGMGTSTNAIDMGKKLVAAYRKDHENYKKYAKVFETCLNAFDVGEEVLKNPLSTGTPITSAEVSSLRPEQRLDAWGHPFCLVTIDSRLAVISGGPEA